MLSFFGIEANTVIQSRDSVVAAVAKAEQFRIQPVLDRYDAEHRVGAAEARRVWRELVRYLIMVGLLRERDYGMYGPVDELWHHFVLHTEFYEDFCATHTGGFVHHHPGSTPKGSAWRARYLQFLIDYREIFGEAPPDDLWPLPGVSKVKLPASSADLQQRHVKAMARLESGLTARGRGRAAALLGCGGAGCSGVGWSGGGEDGGGCGGGGCGGGGCGGGGGD